MSEPSNLNTAIYDMLLDCGLFDSLPPSDLASVAGYFSITDFTRDQVIFNEGDAGTFMCIIHQGSVVVRKLNPDGKPVDIATLRRGRALGEMAVLDGERRSASCIAASDCQLLTLGRDSLDKMIEEMPKMAARIIRALAISLSKRLRMVDGQLLAQQV
ncbi:cyclic nucleotide-binding domain-containing protein [Pseudomonas sp. DTU_2021_1001937_2_SI_NGA_ILE_001]|uniref:Crp/Fnr family transcriptional regulator n=1 Tax=Pseudomonas sp. DTU_2021_1001937_2_SI_NGA_ILE_001 TaxID=3077589 RepID=UPI0025FC3CE1|nr:cyclic nucleotide-binding domain-containing protein [Pseudomonas sp. DTU_2021_1001937_2_SI_NGA_ILE_001]WNW11223.1 cyclic nucleotide-binding domain-containing protein [Pseudomonas sp. DTU_2021_1001937_2_SI_NGA_ILE_001]